MIQKKCYISSRKYVMLGIVQKKGNDNHLCGRMIAYAKILPTPDGKNSGTPFDEMIHNGLLALEGDFRQFSPTVSPKNMKKAVDDKLNDLLSTMEEEGMEIPESLDVDAFRERLHELSNMEVIPIPAQIGRFENEDEIMKSDADIYYIGEYIGVNQAHFCLTTLPIYYQARYREQAKKEEMDILNEVLAQFEAGEVVNTDDLQSHTEVLFPEGVSINTFVGDMNKLLNTRVIPFLLNLKTETEYEKQIALFYKFMKGYPYSTDGKRIDKAVPLLREQRSSTQARQLLELCCLKISAVYNEDKPLAKELELAIKVSEF